MKIEYWVQFLRSAVAVKKKCTDTEENKNVRSPTYLKELGNRVYSQKLEDKYANQYSRANSINFAQLILEDTTVQLSFRSDLTSFMCFAFQLLFKTYLLTISRIIY